MNSDLKAKWLEALRGVEFEQNFGSIGGSENNLNKLCCIGVGGRAAGLKAGFAGNQLTRDCAFVLGLSDEQCDTLWRMNDNERKSFSAIADYIEQNL